ncbi:uncharacterized protein MELLADRAFT_95065 [Melampsora larici-populina 98AG31]|uniref:Uncharacterized protein n=1 Tax=Melampsora larici-populina (strain 98AG31 / pathotype 3-4-7) TaxID=747676 RepID=F4S8Z7_MELLP|nr:uncharacterized protein MELLADRAFT_95065 [Melampsora larici-populina 98AG31]EGF98895.1 hypothetical protein MELLADRAFT_95065 [Melampsora larici-populina 98AG31]
MGSALIHADTDEFTECAMLSTATNNTPGNSTAINCSQPNGAIKASVLADMNKILTDHHAVNFGLQKYRHGLEWDWAHPRGYLVAIKDSITAQPLPKAPPLTEDKCAAYAPRQYPDTFKVVCPVDIPIFQHLLAKHPNRPFVDSVVHGLTHGFWPMASIPSDEVVDHPNHKVCYEHPEVLTTTRDEEVAAGRFSSPFHHLLPGMKVSPLLLASKPGSNKLCMCTNMSFGQPSLNDLIDKDKAHVSYSPLATFGPYMKEVPFAAALLILWKSDVAWAYQNMPMHPQWQIRQIIKIANLYYGDRCTNFGLAASPKIWCSFFSLVLWIAINRLRGVKMLLNQALLLLLFDTINLPWVWKKQLSGQQLKIIGHYVNAVRLSFSLSPEKKAALDKNLQTFTAQTAHRLRVWQSTLGWASWGLNAIPYG